MPTCRKLLVVLTVPFIGSLGVVTGCGKPPRLATTDRCAGDTRCVTLTDNNRNGDYADDFQKALNDLAFDGYDSYQLYERLRIDGIQLDPDLVIVNSGINDVRNARFPDLRDRDSRTLLWRAVIMKLRADRIRGRPTIWNTIKQNSYLARFPGFVRQRWNQTRGLAKPSEITAHDEALAYFERNLMRIAELLAERGTPIIFSTPPSALPMNFEPTDTSTSSYWLNNAATTQEYRDSLAGRMETVVETLRRRGQPVRYIRPVLAPELFLDDCHLTPEGSRSMAVRLADAAHDYISSASATRTASGN